MRMTLLPPSDMMAMGMVMVMVMAMAFSGFRG